MSSVTGSIQSKIKALKAVSGTHSPSIATMLREIPELSITVDACFLSNPYATDLFLTHLQREVVANGQLRNLLEFYPPQNRDVAGFIAQASNLDIDTVFVGNGAIEAIQAVMHRFAGSRVALPYPTFSSYYEFALSGTEIIPYALKKDQDYLLDVDDYIRFIHEQQADTAILINPNNPNGGYLHQSELRRFLESLQHLKMVVIDESFVHFAYEDDALHPVSVEPWVASFPNLVVIKSMSKDFGIAGIRAGYAVMHPDRVRILLGNGYLWNVSGLADYFFKLYAQESFRTAYEDVRKRYIRDTTDFLSALGSIDGLRLYPSKANFALIELTDPRWSSFDFCMDLLCDHSVYVRDCSDKAGLDGAFIRVASRSAEENTTILKAIRQTLA